MRPLPRRAMLAGALATGALTTAAQSAAATFPALALHRGVNAWPWFSLTREYPAPRTDYGWPAFETQRPIPTPSDLRRLRASGLDFVRIPVDPGPFLAFDDPQRTTLLDMLFAAVAEVLAAGLAAIVNVQASGTHYWTPERMYGSADAPAFGGYLDLVTSIARRLAKMDQGRVALEPINEPPQGCASPIWPDVQGLLLGSARHVAPGLTLIATGGCGSMVSGLAALDPAPLAHLAPLLFTFHFYEPYLFSHQGAPWMREPIYRALNDVPWPASAGSLDATLAAVRARMARDHQTPPDAQHAAYVETEKALRVYFDAQPDVPFVRKYLSTVKEWGDQHGIAPARIVMGEFGALRTDARYTAAPAADRARYIRDVRSTAEAFGFPWAFWNLFDGMGMMDDTTKQFDPAIVAALGLTLPHD